ncbi:molybdopterin-binding protein [Seohaeicola saemankumensis]|uniref:Molybdopterin molybdenumtransferase n=1 Tax=Seohaeicola saemankumensis TaxID=481181 RepID=A0ABW3T876_9RHOB
MTYSRVAILDWSAAGKPARGKDSIWLALDGEAPENLPTRAQAETRLIALIEEALAAGERLLLGADFAFGYPQGFAATVAGGPLHLWDWLADKHADTDRNESNYRDVAARLNALFPGEGPFWGNGRKAQIPGLPRLKPALPVGLAQHRLTEAAAASPGAAPKSVWQLAGAGAVGAQTLTGLPMLARLRRRFAGTLSVWPFEEPAQITLAEVYPSMLADAVRLAAADSDLPPDAHQVRLLAQALARLDKDMRARLLDRQPLPGAALAEGWILGAGAQAQLRAALSAHLTPPRLRNDCFAMPQGVAWAPVDTALAKLRDALHPVTGQDVVRTHEAAGRVLAMPATARRSNPPRPNAAVDGYGFAHAATGSGPQRLPLARGRAAAGQPYMGRVPQGHAIRILTGAILPAGVDTVVLEEDCATDGLHLVFDGPVKPRANTRRAGEDMEAGQLALPAGHVLRAPDLALLTALGIDSVAVRKPLRVGVLSTGDELLTDPAAEAAPHQIYDANRPMLLSLAARWGHAPVDLGHMPDDPDAIRKALMRGAEQADVVLTSGGASAGDEDHVSRLLRTEGNLSSWRIAVKPGRPLALAMWHGVPVFGLPGNPVAALVCALIFARPALSLMAGSGWTEPDTFVVPAAFSKDKKAGRREYLRARLNAQGEAEVFASEGSGRISGLSWARGLVELPDDAAQIRPGALVRYIPYASFGL